MPRPCAVAGLATGRGRHRPHWKVSAIRHACLPGATPTDSKLQATCGHYGYGTVGLSAREVAKLCGARDWKEDSGAGVPGQLALVWHL